MPSYSDIHKAIRVEKRQIWFAWVCGWIILILITSATASIPVLNVITKVLLAVVGILLTITAVRMTRALSRKDDAARREILGDL